MTAPSFLAWIPAVAAASTAAVANYTFANKSGPGDTISDTLGTAAALTALNAAFDTHTVAVGDRLLLMSQTPTWQNGVYIASLVETAFGQAATLTLASGGTGYAQTGYTDQVFYNLPTTSSGSGTGALVDVIVVNNSVVAISISQLYIDSLGETPTGEIGSGVPASGSGYAVGDTIVPVGLGAGTGLSVTVASLLPAFILRRAPDANTPEQLSGMSVFVNSGATNAGKAFVQTNAALTLDVTNAVSGNTLVVAPAAETPYFPIVNGTYTNIPLVGGHGTGAGVSVVVNQNSLINLKSAATYAVLASSTVTSTGNSVVTGNLGLYPGSSVTGFPPATVSGTQNVTNTTAQQAVADAQAAYTAGQAIAGGTVLSATTYEFGGTAVTPGVYKVGTGATITGTVTLNGNGTYIFQIGSTLTAEASSVVALTGGAKAANVFWLVGTSATLNSAATFNGTVIANASISLASTASVVGNLLALTGAVTLIDNAVTAASPYTVTFTSLGSGYQNGDVLEFGNYSGVGAVPGGYYGLGSGGTVLVTTATPASSAVTFVELVA